MAERIRAKLAAIEAGNRADVQAITGSPAMRLRVGKWRIIFVLDRGDVVVLDVRTRGDAYK